MLRLQQILLRPKLYTRHFSSFNPFEQMSVENQVNFPQLVSACYSIGERAGTLVRNIYEEHSGDLDKLQATDKSDLKDDTQLDDPQTIADLKAQKMIAGSLYKTFPNLKMIGEEGELEVHEDDVITPDLELMNGHSFPAHLKSVNSKDIVIWIDPLDGTKEYTEGILECVTVLIGIAVQGRAVAGIVSQPFVNKVVWGVKGVGAFGHKPVSPFPDDSRRWIITTRSHFTPEIQTYMNACRPENILRYGGCGGKVIMLLEGNADCYVFPSLGTKKWDTCAPQAVLEAAGGVFTLPDGSDFLYDDQPKNLDGFIASYRADHDSYLRQNLESQEKGAL